jgi:hypothetical protein
MKMGEKICLCITAAAVLAGAQVMEGNRGRIGVGYDEGLAGRFFFTKKIGVQASIGMERLGEYEQNEEEYNVSFGGAFLYNFFSSTYIYLDGMAQLAVVHDGSRAPDDIGDITWLFIRIAAAPEILIADHLGFGMRFGFETAIRGDTKRMDNGQVVENDDGRVNIRFYGPSNPFNGSTLGASFFFYFGDFF